MEEDDVFGTDIEYNDELETALRAAESQHSSTGIAIPSIESGPIRELDGSPIAVDIEDVIQQPNQLSPFDEFRKRGWLSVSDLVGTVWCELQVIDVGCCLRRSC